MERYNFIGYHTAEGLRFAPIYWDWTYEEDICGYII